MRPRLFLNHIPDLDWLIALEFGRVDDGQPPEHWRGVCESVGYLEPGGVPAGFTVLDFSALDVDDPDAAGIWAPPHFDVPALGLSGVCAGEIIVAARAFFDGKCSINRIYFEEAIEHEGEDALELWRAALEAGDSMAHYGIGYTLYDLGRVQDAYRHLRHYTEIAPDGHWSWSWYGKAAEALGLHGEAAAAYRRAIELADEREEDTEATELLARLQDRAS